MDVEILEEFIALAENCRFQETAELLHISQSSLSKHLKKLEAELGAALFDRSTRTVTLSEYGKAFLPHARRIAEEKASALAEFRELSAAGRKTVTVSYAPVLSQYGLIETLSAFCASHPELTLRTLEHYRPAELLRAGGCDFAFSEGGEDLSGFRRRVYLTDRLAVVFPAGHPMAGRRSVSLSELTGERFILHSRQGGPPHEETEKFLALCRAQAFSPEIAAESEYTSTMLRLVIGGRGIAVLNRLHIPESFSGVAIAELDPPAESFIYLLSLNKLNSPAAEEFLCFLEK